MGGPKDKPCRRTRKSRVSWTYPWKVVVRLLIDENKNQKDDGSAQHI